MAEVPNPDATGPLPPTPDPGWRDTTDAEGKFFKDGNPADTDKAIPAKVEETTELPDDKDNAPAAPKSIKPPNGGGGDDPAKVEETTELPDDKDEEEPEEANSSWLWPAVAMIASAILFMIVFGAWWYSPSGDTIVTALPSPVEQTLGNEEIFCENSAPAECEYGAICSTTYTGEDANPGVLNVLVNGPTGYVAFVAHVKCDGKKAMLLDGNQLTTGHLWAKLSGDSTALKDEVLACQNWSGMCFWDKKVANAPSASADPGVRAMQMVVGLSGSVNQNSEKIVGIEADVKEILKKVSAPEPASSQNN